MSAASAFAFGGPEGGVPRHPEYGTAEAVYTYRTEDATPLFYVCRFRTDEQGGKTFLQGHLNGSRWVWNIRGVERRLYRWPELAAHLGAGSADPIYIPEGEKDVHAVLDYLAEHELPGTATCNPMGAGKWSEEYTEALRGARHVVVVADNDDSGLAHARKIAAELGPQVGLLELRRPALEHKGADLSDHLEAGLGLEELLEVAQEPGHEEPEPFLGLSHAEVLDLRFEGERHLVADLIEIGTVGAIAGVPETYKSRLAQGVATAIALGDGEVLGRKVEVQGPVGYFWQDDSRRNEAERVQTYSAVRELPRDLSVRWHLNEGLELPRDLARLCATIEAHGYVLVVLDSFYNFVDGIELKSEDAAVIVASLKREVCDPTGCTVLIVDHAPWPSESNAGQRRAYGSVLKSAAIRWAIFLERKGASLYVQASGNNVRGIPRTPVAWVDEAHELRLIGKADVEEAYEEARAWILEYVEREAEHGRSPARGETETAYAAAHDGKGRSRARRLIDAELGAFDAWLEMPKDERKARRADGEPEPALARGTGEAPNGVYLKPFSNASSPLAAGQTARSASSLSGATEGEQLAVLATHPKGGEQNGEQARGGGGQPKRDANEVGDIPW